MKGNHMDIRFLIMDVDGTLTDGKIYMSDHGEFCKAFNIKAGCGIHDLLPPAGITPVVITGRKSRILEIRCIELAINELHQGIHDKFKCLTEIMERKCADLSQAAYIGDDLNDIPCMHEIKKRGGITGCPADAVEAVKKSADFVSCKRGGEGAVREFIEFILDK